MNPRLIIPPEIIWTNIREEDIGEHNKRDHINNINKHNNKNGNKLGQHSDPLVQSVKVIKDKMRNVDNNI